MPGIGGLVGWNGGTITHSRANGTVSGEGNIGGIAGINVETILYSHSTSEIFADWNAGGLVGINMGVVTLSSATGNVTGESNIGGLVGYNCGGEILESFATGDVDGTWRNIGGLVGLMCAGEIRFSYATGDVMGSANVGGLVGGVDEDGVIQSTFASGTVSGDSEVGGIAGWSEGEITESIAINPSVHAEVQDQTAGRIVSNLEGLLHLNHARVDMLVNGSPIQGFTAIHYNGACFYIDGLIELATLLWGTEHWDMTSDIPDLLNNRRTQNLVLLSALILGDAPELMYEYQ
jgi:hypothetical protein